MPTPVSASSHTARGRRLLVGVDPKPVGPVQFVPGPGLAEVRPGQQALPVSWGAASAHAPVFLASAEERLGTSGVFLGHVDRACDLRVEFITSLSIRRVGTRWGLDKRILPGVLGESYISSDRVYSNVFLNYS